jgi:hypothetical protein
MLVRIILITSKNPASGFGGKWPTRKTWVAERPVNCNSSKLKWSACFGSPKWEVKLPGAPGYKIRVRSTLSTVFATRHARDDECVEARYSCLVKMCCQAIPCFYRGACSWRQERELVKAIRVTRASGADNKERSWTLLGGDDHTHPVAEGPDVYGARICLLGKLNGANSPTFAAGNLHETPIKLTKMKPHRILAVLHANPQIPLLLQTTAGAITRILNPQPSRSTSRAVFPYFL